MATRKAALEIARRLRAAGFPTYFAGGCVRDRLRGVEPRDHDLATAATPDRVQALFERTRAVGAVFGVVIVLDAGDPCEVATFRSDVGVDDGRHPARVRYAATPEEDARRRDFTINGMFEDPESGAVLDFVGGIEDLHRRVVRTIGAAGERFREDRLRMLRAVRFATVLDFRLDPVTRRAIAEHARDLEGVSAERIRDELDSILRSGRGGRGLGLLSETGLLDGILPEVAALDGVAQPPRFHPEGDVLTHTRLMLDELEPGAGRELALAALLHDVGKAPTACVRPDGRLAFPNHAPVGARMAGDILRRLRYPKRVIERTETLVRRHMDWPVLQKMREAKRRRFLLRDDFETHHALHRLDCEACHGDLSVYDYAAGERARLLAEPPPVRPLLDGHALIRLGYRPGPAFRAMLEALVDAQLEGRVTDVRQARAFLRERFAPPDGRTLAGEPGA